MSNLFLECWYFTIIIIIKCQHSENMDVYRSSKIRDQKGLGCSAAWAGSAREQQRCWKLQRSSPCQSLHRALAQGMGLLRNFLENGMIIFKHFFWKKVVFIRISKETYSSLPRHNIVCSADMSPKLRSERSSSITSMDPVASASLVFVWV